MNHIPHYVLPDIDDKWGDIAHVGDPKKGLVDFNLALNGLPSMAGQCTSV